MARKRKKEGWAGFPLIVGVLGLIALAWAYVYRPELLSFAMAATTALLGITSLWAFVRKDIWWAVIPGVGLLTLAAICLVYCFLLGNITWMGVLLLGLGAYVIAVIPNERVGINLFYLLGLILVLVSIYLSPIVRVWQLVLAIAFLLLFALTLWLDREDLRRIWA